jgi:hypothetical protein
MEMQDEGRPMTEIRRIIDETYQGVNISTDTPLPPEGL